MSCAAAGDCASGQVCSADGFCAAPDVSCVASQRDAGVPTHDGHPTDGGSIVSIDAAVPDAPSLSSLQVHIDGQGRVTIVGVGTCEAAAPDSGDCTFTVLPNVQLDAIASPYNDWRFDKWTSSQCAMESTSTCLFAAHGATTALSLKFRKDN